MVKIDTKIKKPKMKVTDQMLTITPHYQNRSLKHIQAELLAGKS